MDFVDRIVAGAKERVQEMDYTKTMRIVIVVGGYVLIRQLVQRELAKRQLKHQLDQDKLRKQNKLIDRPAGDDGSAESTATATTAAAEPTTFGWGNKTRYRVQKQQEQFAAAVDQLKQEKGPAAFSTGASTAYDADSDEDIADLLED